MTLAIIDEVIEFDEDGRVDGLQFDSRERALQEWRERKEDREYQSLFVRLYKRNWARKLASSPEGRERLQANNRRYRQQNIIHCRAVENARRKRKYDANPVVNQCEECGQCCTPPYEQRNKRSRFCGNRCRSRFYGRARSQRRKKGMRQMDLRDKIFKLLETAGPLTAKQIAELLGTKPGSTYTSMCKWVKAGEIRNNGGRPAVYYIPLQAWSE
jgi:hypothetical protein